ncbi:MAG: MFS transporter [Halioglobus sp.]
MNDPTPSLADTVARARVERTSWLRRTLRLSQQESVASATMTATGDNFFNALAIHLQASATQMGALTAVPQLFGAWMQLLSIWIGSRVPRKQLVVSVATFQALVVAAIGWLAMANLSQPSFWLIVLASIYSAALNLIQPHWRAWMGSLVPARRRGAFFAIRTRLTMVSSLLIFIAGGGMLTLCAQSDNAELGFALLFVFAALGRGCSALLLSKMHDPEPLGQDPDHRVLRQSLQHLVSALREPGFRHYTFFLSGMMGAVAISAPFFAVHMLDGLGFSYLQFSINAATSIVTQFLLLGFWGRFTDRHGNRLAILLTGSLLPCLPLLWLVSPNFYYLLLVQVVSGALWSGFSLSTSNFLYDLRPHRTGFAAYAAVQASITAAAVFVGGLTGGFLAAYAPRLAEMLSDWITVSSPLFLVFTMSAVLRVLVIAWFIPRVNEPQVRRRPDGLKLIYRISRFSALSGISLDWLTVTRKKSGKK